ncbi:MAG: tetratricopeptide repeat protein [Candidatus Dormibacteraceae bacterium]
MTPPDWSADVEAALGNTKTFTVEDAVAAVADLGKQGKVEAAFELAVELLSRTTEDAAYQPTIAILNAIEPHEASFAASQRGWLKNYRGLALVAKNKLDDASGVFREAWRLARKSMDLSLQSNVALNLGAVAHQQDSIGRATRWYRIALQQSLAIEDFDLGTKVLLNLAGIAVDRGGTARAHRLLEDLENILAEVRDPGHQATLHHVLGRSAVARHDLRTATREFRKAAHLARKSERPRLVATSLQNLGAALLESGKPRLAMPQLRESLDICNRLGADPLRVTVLQSMALTSVRLGETGEAKATLEEIRRLSREIGDPANFARATMDLGALEAQEKRYDIATHHLREAMAGADHLDADWMRQAASNLISVGVLAGDKQLVQANLEQVLARLPSRDHAGRGEAMLHAATGLITLDAPLESTEPLIEAALRERTLARDRLAFARDAANAGAMLRDHHQFASAERLFTRALQAYNRESQDPLAFHLRNDRALVWVRQGKTKQARRELEKCLALARQLRNRPMEIQARGNLGEVNRLLGDRREARRNLEIALRIARSLGDKTEIARLLGNRGLVALDERRLSTAEHLFSQQQDLALELRSRDYQAAAVGGLAGVKFRRGAHREAGRLFRAAAKLRTPPIDDDSERHLAEDLAGALESYSKAGIRRSAQRSAQDLVNLAQSAHFESFAADSLVRAGRAWLERGATDEAASMFFAALALTAVQPDATDSASTDFGRRIAEVAVSIEADLIDQKSVMYDSVIEQFRKEAPAIADVVAELIPIVAASARETIARIRSNDSSHKRAVKRRSS